MPRSFWVDQNRAARAIDIANALLDRWERIDQHEGSVLEQVAKNTSYALYALGLKRDEDSEAEIRNQLRGLLDSIYNQGRAAGRKEVIDRIAETLKTP